MSGRLRALDLRLAVPALAAWAVAVVATAGGAVVRGGVAAAATLLVLLAVRWGSRGGGGAHRSGWGPPVPMLLLTAAAMLAVDGSVVVQDAVRRPPALLAAVESGSVTVVLRVDSPPSRAAAGLDGGGRVSFAATLEEVGSQTSVASMRSPVRVLAPGGGWGDLVPGARVSAPATLRPTAPSGRPTALVLVRGDPVPRGVPPPPQVLAARVRADLRGATAGLPGHAQLLPGIAVGDDDRVPVALADAMSATSLGHLLAVSGAHVAIVLGLVMTLAGGLSLAIRLAIGVLVLGGLVLLVGPEPSVVRASAMGVVLLLALALGRRGQAMAALSAAVGVLVLLDPWIAGSIGFALSVSATAGIVLGSGRLTAAIADRLGRAAALAPALAVPLAAQIACLPVLLLVDPGVATYAVPANALVAPVVPAVTLLGLGAAVLGGVWPAGAHALLLAATPGTWWIDQVATRLASAPLARLPWPAGWRGLLLAVVLTGAAWRGRAWWRRHGRVATAAGLALVLVAVVVPATRQSVGDVVRPVWSATSVAPGWRVVACDVGQGAAVLVSAAPEGGGEAGAVVLDVGPPDSGLGPCLRAAGVSRVVALVLSHADLDHVGGLDELLAVASVERAYLPDVPEERLAEVRRALVAADVPVVDVVVADEIPAGPVASVAGGAATLEFLWPTRRAVELRGEVDESEANGLSLAVLVRAGGTSVLAVGDLGAGAQAALLRTPALAAVLDAGAPDVTVVAHHGSPDADPAFLAAASGRVALVSVGDDNRYGHPAPWVLTAIDEAGSLPVRTDLCGTATVRRADGGRLEVTRCVPPAQTPARAPGSPTPTSRTSTAAAPTRAPEARASGWRRRRRDGRPP